MEKKKQNIPAPAPEMAPPAADALVPIEICVSIAAADWSHYPGEVIMVKPELAEAWIAAGHAKEARKDVDPATLPIHPPHRPAEEGAGDNDGATTDNPTGDGAGDAG